LASAAYRAALYPLRTELLPLLATQAYGSGLQTIFQPSPKPLAYPYQAIANPFTNLIHNP